MTRWNVDEGVEGSWVPGGAGSLQQVTRLMMTLMPNTHSHDTADTELSELGGDSTTQAHARTYVRGEQKLGRTVQMETQEIET